MNELTINADITNIETVLDFVNGQIGDCPPAIQNKIGIVVDEILSNIARYAYHPLTGTVTVRISIDDAITIEFEDSGAAYDPLSADDPDVTLPAGERKPGGLGIFIVKNMMDFVGYQRERGKNILVVKKFLDNSV